MVLCLKKKSNHNNLSSSLILPLHPHSPDSVDVRAVGQKPKNGGAARGLCGPMQRRRTIGVAGDLSVSLLSMEREKGKERKEEYWYYKKE